jgi:hypothetical protein
LDFGFLLSATYFSELDVMDTPDEFLPILAPQGDVCWEVADLRNDAKGDATVCAFAGKPARWMRRISAALEPSSPVMLAI